MNRILNRANVKLSLSSAAFLIASSSVLGIILGIVRTKLINANFNNFSTGAYFAAFKIPDFIFFTLAAGALSVAFIPVISDKLSTGNKQQAHLLTSYVINVVAIVMLVLSLLLIAFPRPILEYIIAPGFSPERLDVAAHIMRLVALNPLIFAIASIMASYQHAIGRFFFFAVAPLFYNLSIIASIYIFKDSMGVVGLGVGVAIGSALSLLVTSLGMFGLGFKHRLKINLRDKSLRQVLKALPPRSADQGISYINSIVQTRFASMVSIDAVTNFENALLLYNAPINLIGLAIGTAAFPRFTTRLSQGRSDLFKKEFLVVIRALVWITIPVVAVSYFARDYMARIIFARDNREIAIIFGFLCIGILFRVLYSIISRFYYAQKDTITPLIVTIFAILLNVVLAWKLSRPEAYGVAGLAITASLVAMVDTVILIAIMAWRDHKLFHKQFRKDLWTILSAGAFVALAAFIFAGWLPLDSNDAGFILIIKVGLIGLLTFIAHVLVSLVFGISEARLVIRRIKKTLWRSLKI